jgi:hypothetical protein
MTPKAEQRRELIAVRAMREQEWAYTTRVIGHRSVADTSRLSVEASPLGLGYYLSPHMVKGLLTVYAERMRETLEESPAERIAQELDDLDRQYRAAARLADPVDREATAAAEAAYNDGYVERLVTVYRDEKTILGALTAMGRIGERRAALLGLNAEVKSRVTVEHVDATDRAIQELAAELDDA